MVDDRARVDAGKLTEFSVRSLEKLGMPGEDARVMATMLVACDLRGVESHGVAHLRMFYVRRFRQGIINLNPRLKTLAEAPATATIDGDNGFGFIVGYHAMKDAIVRAGNTGVGMVTVRNSTHFGAAAYYAMMALDRDMIGIAMTSSVAIVVAPGSSRPAVSTNPIAVAVPAGKKPPFVLDMATSAAAGGKLEIARRQGKPLPEGWFVDGDGSPVTDVTKQRPPGGGLLPLGGIPDTGAFKGFGLALVVEVLTGILSGSKASLLHDLPQEQRGNYSDHFFGALDVGRFTPINAFKQSMDDMIEALEALPTVPGVDRVTVPGPYEAEIVAERKANGIPLDAAVLDDLKTLGEELEIPFDAGLS